MTIHNYEPRIKQPRGCADGMGVWEPEPEVQKIYGWRRVLIWAGLWTGSWLLAYFLFKVAQHAAEVIWP